MSFAYDAKLEVLKEEVTNDCCAIAFISAIIKCSGQLNISDKKYVVEIFTEIEELFPKINGIIAAPCSPFSPSGPRILPISAQASSVPEITYL